MDLIKNNIVIIIVVVLAIGFFAWFGLSNTVANSGLLVSDTSANSNADQDILKLLLDMKSIKLDSSLFENQAFAALRDFGRDILPEPVGRRNPFVDVNTATSIGAGAEINTNTGTTGAETQQQVAPANENNQGQ